eukprot:scaffold20605_cov110-Skeletonema_dohrnii-CCMP3373.AAC.9
MQLSKSPKRYDTSHPIINDQSSQAAANGIDAEVLLHRLRGGDETNDELAVEEDDNDSSNDVSVTSSEPITVDNSVVEADNEEADEDDTADDINIEAVNSQEEGSLEEVEEQIIDDDETNNIDDNPAVLATEEVEEETTTASDEADMEGENDQAEEEEEEEEETVELVEEEAASNDEHDEETEESASQPSMSDTMANTTPASESESNTDNDYDDDDNDAYDDIDSTDEEATTTTTTTSSPPDTYEVQSNELRTSASDKRAMAKTHHDNGNLKDAAIAFREAAMLLDEAMEALSQSSSMNDNDTKEEEEGNIAVERATCRLHEALCLLKDGRPRDCVEACTDVLEDDVTVVPLDNESENGDDDGADPTQQAAAVVKIIPATTTGTGAANKPAIPAQIRARAHHRRAKARLALGDLDGALEDARSAAFMGDRNAVQFYGRLMREGSATTTGAELSSSPSSSMGMGGGSNPFLDGMLGGMGGNTNPFMPSPGAGSSSDFSSSLLSSLLTGSSGSGSGGGNPFGLMGELLSPPPEESTGSSKRRRGGKAKKDSLAKSVLKNIMKRIEDEETQETICGYLQSTNKQQIMQFSTMARVPIKEETAQRLSGLANGITPRGIRKGVRRVKRGLKVVKTGRKILKVIDKYKPVIIVAVLLYWVRSAILEPYPISKKKKLAQQAALGLLIMPTQKSALVNVRGALSKVFMSPAEADAGSVEDDSSSSGIEGELEKLQHQLTLIEAIEERNKAQIYSFIDEEDQWNSMEEWEQELLSSKEALTQRMEQMTEELVLMFMGEKAKNG